LTFAFDIQNPQQTRLNGILGKYGQPLKYKIINPGLLQFEENFGIIPKWR